MQNDQNICEIINKELKRVHHFVHAANTKRFFQFCGGTLEYQSWRCVNGMITLQTILTLNACM